LFKFLAVDYLAEAVGNSLQTIKKRQTICLPFIISIQNQIH